MSSVDFRWLPDEPVVLNDTEPACQDQARSQRRTRLSPHPSPRRNGPPSRETINYQSSVLSSEAALAKEEALLAEEDNHQSSIALLAKEDQLSTLNSFGPFLRGTI